MSIQSQLERMIDGLPKGASVVLPVDELRSLLAAPDQERDGIMPDMTVPEVARILKRDPSTIRHWVRTGRLRSYKLGRERRIPPDAVEEMIDAARVAGL